MSIKGFQIANGSVQKYDYNSLDNKPILPESFVEVDDTLTEEGQAADAKATGDAVTELLSAIDDITDVLHGNNLTDPNLVYGAAINNDTGVISANNYYCCSDKIPCTPGETLYIYGVNTSTHAVALRKTANDKLAFYTSEDVFISIAYNENSYTVPANAAYCVEQGYETPMEEGTCGVFRVQITTWEPYVNKAIVKTDNTLSHADLPAESKAVGDTLAGKYEKPSGGIPSTDLASAVQTSLGKADTAYQKPIGGIPASDLDPSSVPLLDRTLTNANAAAPADITGEIKDSIDNVYIDYVIEDGTALVPYWEKGDIDSSGNETTSNSYYRTPYIAVDSSKYYLLSLITEDSEGTKKNSAWGNNTYGVIHCYSDSAYLGVQSVTSSGNSKGMFTPLANTTKIRLAHAMVSHITLNVYELQGNDASYKQDIIPNGYGDTTVKTINTPEIGEIGIAKDQLAFLEDSTNCIFDKTSVSPWYLYESNMILTSFFSLDEGNYMIHVVCSGLTGFYVRQYDENKDFIRQANYGAYDYPVMLNVPSDAKYLRVLVGKASVKLSDVTTFKIYRLVSKNIGYGNAPGKVISADILPALPPLAFAGQVKSGILCLGHGGASSLFAEDSIESFYALARNGFNGSEIDIQFTKDHVPVCWHNSTLSVLDGGTSSDHIYDYTLDELDANFDFRTWYNPKPYLRQTVARFEEVCVLARAFGWTIIPDKLTSAEGSEEADNEALIELIKKYKLENQMIISKGFTYLREAFPDCPLTLSAMDTVQDDEWMNALLRNVQDHCHTDEDDNLIVDDDYIVYTSFNWAAIKGTGGTTDCIATNELCAKHNVKLIWYTIETPEDIYQLVSLCPDTSIVLTGAYTIPDGINEYIGIKWSNMKFDLSPVVHQ